MTEHSPLPWKAPSSMSYREPSNFIFDANGKLVALTKAAGSAIEADARLIVQAVNSHKELVEALEECVHELEGEIEGNYPAETRKQYPSQQRRYDRDMSTVLRARAALAKLKGERHES